MREASDPLPLRWGAHPGTGGSWDFAIWAPAAERAELMLDGTAHDMAPVGNGGWQASIPARDGHPTRSASTAPTTPTPPRDSSKAMFTAPR